MCGGMLRFRHVVSLSRHARGLIPKVIGSSIDAIFRCSGDPMEIRFRIILLRVKVSGDTESHRTATGSDGLYRYQDENLEETRLAAATVPATARCAGIPVTWIKFCSIHADTTVRRTLALTMAFAQSACSAILYAHIARHQR